MEDEDKEKIAFKLEPTRSGPQARVPQSKMTVEKAKRLGESGHSVGADADTGDAVVKKESDS